MRRLFIHVFKSYGEYSMKEALAEIGGFKIIRIINKVKFATR